MNHLARATLALSIALVAAAPPHPAPSHAAKPHTVSRPPINPPEVVTAPAGARQAAARDLSAQQRFESRAKFAMFSSGPIKGFLGPAIGNPHRWDEWEWNDWEQWSPQPFYWGGSFWGPWMSGTTASTLQYGAITDVESKVSYPSYEIGPSSPGAQLFADYGLEQTACGASNLVVIWGPNDAAACARPSARVSSGNYQVDPATLTIRPIVSQ